MHFSGWSETHPDADTLANADALPLKLLVGGGLDRGGLRLLLLNLELLLDDFKLLPCKLSWSWS